MPAAIISDFPLPKQRNESWMWWLIPAVLPLRGQGGRTSTEPEPIWDSSETLSQINKATNLGPVSLLCWTGRTWRPGRKGSSWLSRSSGPAGGSVFTFDLFFGTFHSSSISVLFLCARAKCLTRSKSDGKLYVGLGLKGVRSIVAREGK